MAFLVWYDGTRIAEMLWDKESGVRIYILLSAFAGYCGGCMLSSLTYQVAPNARVSGVPFPYILYEPNEEGSDIWIDFPLFWGLFVNIIYWFLVSLAAILGIVRYMK